MAKAKNNDSKYFLVLVAVVAYFVGWSLVRLIKPTMIMASCSDAAYEYSKVYLKDTTFNPSLGYDYLMASCLQDNNIY
jgi:hypothetical protein